MAVLNPNEIFFTAFEPKQANRFIMYIDGIPAYEIKGVGAVNLTQGTVPLNHINVQRFVKGKTTWGTIQFTLFDPITPSGAQAVMEWVRLHHESVTARDGYSDFYKKDGRKGGNHLPSAHRSRVGICGQRRPKPALCWEQ